MVKVTRLVQQHLLSLLKPYLDYSSNSNIRQGSHQKQSRLPPLDILMSNYFREHKSLGPSERKEIYSHAYDLIRYHHLLNHVCKGSTDLELRLNLLHTSDFYAQMENQKLPKWIRCSFPKQLYEKIQKSFSTQYQAFDFCKALNTRAPLTLRINPLKTSRADFMKKLSKFLDIEIKKTQISPYGVIIPSNKNIDLHNTQQFKNGHFQVQDQASQIASFQVKCRPGDIVLDYCSGSGGKSLAIAHLMQGKGQIFLHDPRVKSLQNAKIRFQRAGVQNVQFHQNQKNLEKIIEHKADWVILDVPCSGTGTIRRNPDIKLRFGIQTLKAHLISQQQIFSKSLRYLKKNGNIVYMTCSLLSEQNQQQVKRFISQYGLQVVQNQVLKTKTVKGGMDCMFAVVLRRKKNTQNYKLN